MKLTQVADLSNESIDKDLVTEIDLCGKKLLKLPQVSEFKNLRILRCSRNYLKTLPNLSKNTHLEFLDCSHNELGTISCFFFSDSLKYIDCSFNRIFKLPAPETLPNLIYLNCSHNNCLGKITGVQNSRIIYLDVSSCGLFHLGQLPPCLRFLFCTKNKFTEFPACFENLKFLQVVLYDKEQVQTSYKAQKLLDTIPQTISQEALPELSSFGNFSINDFQDSVPRVSTREKFRKRFERITISEKADPCFELGFL